MKGKTLKAGKELEGGSNNLKEVGSENPFYYLQPAICDIIRFS
jgi:hypothetical protein